jgi:stage V sporulation protein AE
MKMDKKRVIFVTDGDQYAHKAVQHVAIDIGGRCISSSSGNPSRLTGGEIVDYIKQTPRDPVLVMVDDCGFSGEGPGEKVMRDVTNDPGIQVLGAIAVASNSEYGEWAKVDISIDRYGKLTQYGTDKSGVADIEIGRIDGDTVYVLDELQLPVVVGVGDIGKMDGRDSVKRGAPITKKAIEIILERSGHS